MNCEFEYSETRLLDHGYVKLIDAWGSDERIIEAARMSTSGGFVSWEPYEKHPNGDAGLLRYMYKNRHTTPFEMCGLSLEIQAPIMVFRQWHRHRTQSYNEHSARYAPLPNLDYMPTLDRLMREANTSKQSRAAGDAVLSEADAAAWLRVLKLHQEASEALYQVGLAAGVPKELARLPLSVARYSRMWVSANLHNWLNFLRLRRHMHAQEEIRVYALAIENIVHAHFPRTWELFAEESS